MVKLSAIRYNEAKRLNVMNADKPIIMQYMYLYFKIK